MTHLDPWCVVSGRKLFGFACDPAADGGLAWTCSTELIGLQPDANRAVTWSGRHYLLGRRFEFEDLAAEGEEAVLAHRVIREMPVDRGAVAVDRLWLSSCRIARHLGVPAPARERPAVTRFMNRHLASFSNRLAGKSAGVHPRSPRTWRPAAVRKTG